MNVFISRSITYDFDKLCDWVDSTCTSNDKGESADKTERDCGTKTKYNSRDKLSKPTLFTSYSKTDEEDLYLNGPHYYRKFTQAKSDIKKCTHLSPIQKNIFIKFLEFLEGFSYPVYKFKSIHIVSTDRDVHLVSTDPYAIDPYIHHYIRLDNADFNEQIEPAETCLYMNYTGSVFDAYLRMKQIENEFDKQIDQDEILLPNTISDSSDNSDSNSDIASNSETTKKYNEMLNYVTIINCLFYVFLYELKMNTVQALINHPFLFSFAVLVGTVFMYSASKFVSRLYPHYSGVLFNGIMIGITFAMLFMCH